MRKLIVGLIAMFLCINLAMAQKQVSGKVTDTNGAPLPGVSIKVKGSKVGTSTETDGSYSITIPKDFSTLIFSSVGYEDKEVAPIGNNADITLSSSIKNLNEVVVVGYGTRLKKDVTSAVSKVTSKEFQNLPLPSFGEALQGRASGVYINTGSGKLGQALDIRVRGISSISANQQPFVVIDGVPVVSQALGSTTEPDNPLATLNPDDIESIDVLKDASSSAIYGSRASNGVLLITTKSGKQGKTRLNVGYFTGWSKPTKKREFLNAAQYRELFDSAAHYIGSTGEIEFAGNTGTNDWNSNNDTKWSDLAFRGGLMSQYNVSLTGGDARTKFLISGSYNDQKGIIIGNRLTRVTGRINLDHTIAQRFKVGVNLSINQTKNYRVPDDNAFSNPIQLNALPPLHPVRDANGQLNNATLYYNALIEQEGRNKNLAKTFRSISSAYGEWNITQYLNFRSQVGIDWNNLQEEQFLGRRTADGGPGGLSNFVQTTAAVLTWSNTLNFRKTFGEDHNLEALIGTEYQDGKTSGSLVSGRSFPSDQFTKIISAAIISSGSSSATSYIFNSYFARFNYKFKNKYLLGGSIRSDGSSRFSKNYRYGGFPAISAGWIISEENFLKNSKSISYLKLRTSYGRTGNAEIGNFSYLSLFSATPYADLAGIYASQLGTDKLQWEKTNQFDIGLEFGLFNNRITGEVDYFSKKTNDLLLAVPLPATNGHTTIVKNVGDMKNTGWEVMLTGNILTGPFKWTVSANISTYKNEVTRLVAPISPENRTLSRLAVGQPFGQFYGKKYMGVDPQTGDALYMGADGKATNDYAVAPDTIIGNPNPDFYGGFNNTFSYKGFDLSVQCQFVSNVDIYNVAGIFQSVNGDYFDNQTVDQMRFWRKPGDITDIPQPRLYEGNGTGKSSRWVQNGSYFRVKSVNLGYNFPRKWLQKLKIETARIYVAANNLFTFTKYKGYDPEVSSTTFTNTNNITTGNVILGHDFYTPPQARTITVGINLGL